MYIKYYLSAWKVRNPVPAFWYKVLPIIYKKTIYKKLQKLFSFILGKGMWNGHVGTRLVFLSYSGFLIHPDIQEWFILLVLYFFLNYTIVSMQYWWNLFLFQDELHQYCIEPSTNSISEYVSKTKQIKEREREVT